MPGGPDAAQEGPEEAESPHWVEMLGLNLAKHHFLGPLLRAELRVFMELPHLGATHQVFGSYKGPDDFQGHRSSNV